MTRARVPFIGGLESGCPTQDLLFQNLSVIMDQIKSINCIKAKITCPIRSEIASNKH